MSTTLFNNHDFASKPLFDVRFDYNECMNQPFYKELYDLFRKHKDGRKKFSKSFKSYLYTAHKACGILTMHLDYYDDSNFYHDMFDTTLRYLCFADGNDADGDYGMDDEVSLFDHDEICLILMISYALLSAKNNPTIPFDLIEYCENQITEKACVDKNLAYIRSKCFPELNRLLHQDRKDLAIAKWELIVQIFFYDIQNILKSYTQKVDIDITLTPLKWDLGYWSEENLADWICEDGYFGDIIGVRQYQVGLAKHFVSFWKQKNRKLTVVNAIEEWSKQNLEAFGASQLWKIQVRHMGEYREYLKSNSLNPDQLEADRAQAIKELYEYVEEVHKKEVEETAAAELATAQAQRTNLVHLKLSKGKAANNNIINTVRVFNVLHELGFFANANGTPITKTDLFNALATIFACPELTDWSNKLSSSRGQAAGSRKAQLKIFNTMLETQETILDDLDDKAEQRYR